MELISDIDILKAIDSEGVSGHNRKQDTRICIILNCDECFPECGCFPEKCND